MKDDTSTLTHKGESPNEFERDTPATADRSRAEAAIEELRQRGGVFVNAVRATRMPMVLTDPNLPGNPIVFANEAFIKLSGYTMDEVLGQQPHFMNGPGTDPKDAARFIEAIRADQDDITETVQYRKNGSRFVATVLISAFKDDQGRVLNHFMSFLDVTRRVDAEGEVADLKAIQVALRASEQELQQNEEKKSFVLALEDRLRPLADASEMMSAATRFLGTHLKADRAMYAEVEGHRGAEAGTIRGQYIRNVGAGEEDITPFPEHFTYEKYGEKIMEGRYRGETLVVADISTEAEVSSAESAAWLNVGVAAAVVAALVKDGRLVGELGVQSRTPRAWTKSEISLIRDVAERTWAAAERARAEAALRESEEKYRSLFETIGQGYCELELVRDEHGQAVDQLYLNFNPAFERLFGIPVAKAKGRKATEVFPGLEHSWTDTLARAVASGEPQRIEGEINSLGRWFEVFAYPVGGDRVVALYDDITERKKAELALRDSEQHAQTLLAELQHRVRNTLAVVRSIARRTADRSSDLDEMVSHFEGRLNAFSRVQSAVTRSPDAGVELGAMIEDELLAVATREGEQLTIDGPDLHLQSRPAESISLAIHELATNAVKYGALSVPKGKVRVTWALQRNGGPDELVLEWLERGLPERPEAKREGFGHEMLLRSLPYDLGAKTAISFTDDGLRFTLSLPLGPDVIAEEA